MLESFSKWKKEGINIWLNHYTNQWISELVSEKWMNERMNEWMNEGTLKLFNKLTKEGINVNESLNKWTN